MKSQLQIIGLVMLLTPQLFGQKSMDFYCYTGIMDRYYLEQAAITPDTLKIPGMKEYFRWKDFWQNRVCNTSETRGDLETYGKKMMESLQDPRYLQATPGEWNWEYAGPSDLATHNRGIISSLYVNPQDINQIYAGSNSSGMFRTRDGGTFWECVTDNLGLPAMGVNDIAVHPQDPDIIYLALNPLYRSGPAYIYKTTDDCKTWSRVFVPPADKRTAIRVVFSPANPDILFATIQDAVYRSRDAGVNWELIFDALTYDSSWYQDHKLIVEIEFLPGNPETSIIAATGIRNHYEHKASAEIWITHDAMSDQVSWQRVEAGLPEYCDRYSIAVHPLLSGSVYLGYSTGKSPGKAEFNVDRLNMGSLQIEHMFDTVWWQNYSSPFSGMGYWCNGFEVSPSNPQIIFVGGYSVQVLNLENKEFEFYRCSLKDKNIHADQRVFKVVSFNGDTYLFSGNDGGVSRLRLESGSITSCNGNGLNNVQFYGIGHSEKDPEFFIGGTQDNGVFSNGNGSWSSATLGDAYEVLVDPEEPRKSYVTATGGSMFIAASGNFGRTYYNTPQPFASGGLNRKPFVMTTSEPETVYVGYNELFRSMNGCLSWDKLSAFQDPQNGWNCGNAIGSIGITPHNKDVIYVAFIDPTWGYNVQRFFRTSNSGVEWTDLTENLGIIRNNKGITGILVSPFDENKLWLTFNGYAQSDSGSTIHKVLYSEDAGQHWTDISATLPDLPVNTVSGIISGTDYRIIIGNDLGIFLYDPSESSWKNISVGMPYTIVTDIEVNQTSVEILAGTFGRGIWKSKIPEDIKGKNHSPQISTGITRLIISPNPALDKLHVDIPDNMNPADCRMMILDFRGNILLEMVPAGYHEIIDIERLAAGLYLVKLTDGLKTYSAKLIRK